MPSLKVIVDMIFSTLETAFAGNFFLLAVIKVVHQLVIGLMPQIAAGLKAKGVQVSE